MAHRSKPEPWERERNWLSIAIASAVIAAVGIGVAAIWVFAEGDPRERLIRVNTLAPFGVVAIAAITFATVVWRGLITARQADTGLEQLKGLQKQIALTEETNLAALMQKGAELLADENPAKVSAGVASLRAVTEAPKTGFSDPSLALLIDFIARKGEHGHTWRPIQQAIIAVNASAEVRGVTSDQILFFEEDEELAMRSDEYVTDWQIVSAVRSARYWGGSFHYKKLVTVPEGFEFKSVTFNDCTFGNIGELHLTNCRFHQCSFDVVSAEHFAKHSFNWCDFSNTKIPMNGPLPDLRPGYNYFRLDEPPHIMDNPGPTIVLENIFDVHDDT